MYTDCTRTLLFVREMVVTGTVFRLMWKRIPDCSIDFGIRLLIDTHLFSLVASVRAIRTVLNVLITDVDMPTSPTGLKKSSLAFTSLVWPMIPFPYLHY